MPQLDIVLPCYNPADNWHLSVIEQYSQFIKLLPNDTLLTLTIVNDGSSKNCDQLRIDYIKQHVPNLRFISYPINSGKGYALRKGVSSTTGDYCIYTDIDFPYTVESMLAIYQALLNGNDIVAGSRAEGYYAKMPKARIYISKFLKSVIKWLLGLRFTDTQCGLKGFNKKGKAIFLNTTINRYLFDLEFIFTASKSPEVRMQTIEVKLRNDIQFSRMNLNILAAESLNFLKIFFKRWF